MSDKLPNELNIKFLPFSYQYYDSVPVIIARYIRNFKMCPLRHQSYILQCFS